jgi:PEGA domain
VDKPQYTSIPLEELRRIEAEIQRARSVDDLRSLFERLSSIRRTFIDDFDVQLAIGHVQQAIVDRGRVLLEGHYEPRGKAPAPGTAEIFLEENPTREESASGQPPGEVHHEAQTHPDVPTIDARSWKRATYIGAFFAIILFAAFFYLVQTARKLNIESNQQPNTANQAKGGAAQQKPSPGTPASPQTPPVSTNPALRLYTDLSPGTVTIDGGAAQALHDGELELDNLNPGQHAVKLTGGTGAATFNFDSAAKAAPKPTGPPSGDNAMVVTVSTQDGIGHVMTNAQNSVAILDGKEIGPIPPTGLDLPNLGQTDHDLQIRRGTDSQRFVLTYVPAPALTVFVKNDLNAGNLVVLAGEDGADVFIGDQKYRRKTDHGQLRIPNLKVGTYAVRVAKPGYLEVALQTVQIKKGEETRVAFHLQPEPRPQVASLQVSGAQPGTQVLIDGALAATAGADGNAAAGNINPGDHAVELKHDGSQSKQIQRNFNAGETLTLAGPDVMLTKLPPPVQTPPAAAAAPGPEGGSNAPAPTGTAGEPVPMPGSIHRGGGFLIYHETKAPGRYTFSMQLLRGGGFLKGKRLQWFLGYQDTKNYVLFQVDGKHFVVRQVVNGKSEEIRKMSFDANLENVVGVEIAVKPHSVETRLKPSDGGWENMGAASDIASDLTQGKFGVLISGNDEIGVSSVQYGK